MDLNTFQRTSRQKLCQSFKIIPFAWKKENGGDIYIYQFNDIKVFFDEIKSTPEKDRNSENARVRERGLKESEERGRKKMRH